MGYRLTIRLTPRGGRDTVEGFDPSGSLRIRVAAAPVDGAANAALLRLLAKRLGVAPSTLRIASGAQSRVKMIDIRGLDEVAVLARLSAAAGAS